MDTKARSWAKAITWRLLGIVLLGFISYFITRDVGKTASITVIFHGLRLILYYCHERWWERIAWGRDRHPLAHLPVKATLTEDDHLVIQRFLEEKRLIAAPRGGRSGQG